MLPELYSTMTRSIDSVFGMSDQVSGSLNVLLDDRIAKFQREVLQALAWAALGLLAVPSSASSSCAMSRSPSDRWSTGPTGSPPATSPAGHVRLAPG